MAHHPDEAVAECLLPNEPVAGLGRLVDYA